MFRADNPFMPQARLAVRVLRHVAKEKELALKGGTAINLFYRDLPRLSVDLDLTYVKVAGREESLKAINAALERIGAEAEKGIAGAKVNRTAGSRVVVREGQARVTVEVNEVLRGSVRPSIVTRARAAVEDVFGDLEATVLSFEDCFGGKMVAALDRQHPRDLFDIRQLLAAEGLTRTLLDAFVVYLASHGRPMSEVLAPRDKDIARTFENEFAEMTAEPVSLESLLEARTRLVAEIRRRLLPRHVQFLRSVKDLAPDWSLLPHPEVKELPGIRWRLQNLEKFRSEQPQRYSETRAKLENVLRDLPERNGQ
jgi:predicted nucleotidyltransferase component of viral defense system